MAIKELTQKTLGKTKTGWTYDRKRGLFVTFQVDTHFNGERHIRRGFRSEEDAKSYIESLKLQERLSEIGVVHLIKYPTVGELFEKRLADIENYSEKIRATRVFSRFLSLLKKGTTIDQIQKSDFKRFADARIADGVGKKTVNREINPIAKAFSSVPDYYKIPKWTKPAVWRFSVSRAGRSRLIEPAEYEKLLAFFLEPQKDDERDVRFTARRRTGLILQFALMSGLRHGEICAIEKARLNRHRREVNVYRFKLKRWKMLSPLTDTMLYLFNEGAALYPESKYFFSEKGKLQAGFYDQMKKACEKFDIPYGKFTEGGLILHDARHTFSTILHQNLIDDRTTTEFTDNPTAVGNYQHSTDESKKRAMNVIEEKFGAHKKADKEKELKKIFTAAASGKIKFAEFKKRLEHFLTVF